MQVVLWIHSEALGARTPAPPPCRLSKGTATNATADSAYTSPVPSIPACVTSLGLSTFHFLRLLAAATGEPPRRYLVRLRLSEARRLLEAGDASPTEIAYRCGFSSATHLAAALRRELGTSPTAYRRDRHQ